MGCTATAGKLVPDIFSVSVPDSTLPIPSLESNRLCPYRRPRLCLEPDFQTFSPDYFPVIVLSRSRSPFGNCSCITLLTYIHVGIQTRLSIVAPGTILGLCSRLDSTDYFPVIVPSPSMGSYRLLRLWHPASLYRLHPYRRPCNRIFCILAVVYISNIHLIHFFDQGE